MFTKNMSESLGARCFTSPKDSIKESRPGFEKAQKHPRTALASVKMCPHISRSRLRPSCSAQSPPSHFVCVPAAWRHLSPLVAIPWDHKCTPGSKFRL